MTNCYPLIYSLNDDRGLPCSPFGEAPSICVAAGRGAIACALAWAARSVLPARRRGAGGRRRRRAAASAGPKSCILVYLFGGPSHIDIWDMKPAAPAGNPRRVQADRHQRARHPDHRTSAAPGRGCADQYAVVRSLAHGDTAHGSAGHTMMTGRRPRVLGEVGPNADDYPHYGAVLTRLRPGAARRAAVRLAAVGRSRPAPTSSPARTAASSAASATRSAWNVPADQSLTSRPPLTDLPADVADERETAPARPARTAGPGRFAATQRSGRRRWTRSIAGPST